jgi:hypothetical protein
MYFATLWSVLWLDKSKQRERECELDKSEKTKILLNLSRDIASVCVLHDGSFVIYWEILSGIPLRLHYVEAYHGQVHSACRGALNVFAMSTGSLILWTFKEIYRDRVTVTPWFKDLVLAVWACHTHILVYHKKKCASFEGMLWQLSLINYLSEQTYFPMHLGATSMQVCSHEYAISGLHGNFWKFITSTKHMSSSNQHGKDLWHLSTWAQLSG